MTQRMEREAYLSESTHIHVTRRQIRKNVPIHWHEFFELEFIVSGNGTGSFNGQNYVLEPGVIYLSTTADFHSLVPESEILDLICVSFDQSSVQSNIIEQIFAAEHNLFFKLSRQEYVQFYNLLMPLVTEFQQENENKERYMENILECIFILLLRKAKLENTNKSNWNSYVSSAISYLEIHFRESPALDTVADFVGLNKNYLSSLFHRETGKTMVRYMNDLKLSFGRKMLMATDLTVNEICYASGFHSFSPFMHEFKKKYGKTPMQYRKENAAKNLR